MYDNTGVFGTVYDRLGASPVMPAYQPGYAYAPEIARGSAINQTAPPWHHANPMFWFGVLIFAAAGLIGIATETRVGPAKASVSIGDT